MYTHIISNSKYIYINIYTYSLLGIPNKIIYSELAIPYWVSYSPQRVPDFKVFFLLFGGGAHRNSRQSPSTVNKGSN